LHLALIVIQREEMKRDKDVKAAVVEKYAALFPCAGSA